MGSFGYAYRSNSHVSFLGVFCSEQRYLLGFKEPWLCKEECDFIFRSLCFFCFFFGGGGGGGLTHINWNAITGT